MEKGKISLFGSGRAGLVTYESTVDDSGEEFAVVYVSCFPAVAKLQLQENMRVKKAKSASLVPVMPAYAPTT